MRKLATVLALSLAATHGLPRGSVIAKNEDNEAVNSGRKPLMGSISPPGFVGGAFSPTFRKGDTQTFYFDYVDGFVCTEKNQSKNTEQNSACSSSLSLAPP